MKALIVMVAVGLAGCQSNRPLNELSYTEIKALAVVIEQRCEEQGVKRGDPNWDACTKQEINRESSRRNRIRQAVDSTVVCNRVGTTTICN